VFFIDENLKRFFEKSENLSLLSFIKESQNNKYVYSIIINEDSLILLILLI
jgi:hypothetical protein